MVFGTFDGLHYGHRAFLKEAKKYGDYLIVVLPPDYIVEKLKGRPPKLTLSQRIEHLRNIDDVDEVVVGDDELGSWKVIKKHKPDVIALGHDQNLIKKDLERYLSKSDWRLEVRVIKKFKT